MTSKADAEESQEHCLDIEVSKEEQLLVTTPDGKVHSIRIESSLKKGVNVNISDQVPIDF